MILQKNEETLKSEKCKKKEEPEGREDFDLTIEAAMMKWWKVREDRRSEMERENEQDWVSSSRIKEATHQNENGWLSFFVFISFSFQLKNNLYLIYFILFYA